ncbi:hypothetical protein CYMTET_19380, partial [Cymbomonas tetramitiformis]
MVQEAMDLQRCFGRNLEEVLLRVFGIQSLRPLQVEAIKALESKYDSLIILATGAGKSLIYQLPAVLNCGVTVVLSPILALIQDQVAILEDQEVAAEVWNSTCASKARRPGLTTDLSSDEPETRLLYTTPESLLKQDLQGLLSQLHEKKLLSAFVVDEAHCALQWGFDFRPSYLQFKILRQKFPSVPVQALTATCRPEDRGALAHALGLLKPIVIEGSPDRKEISYQVRHKELIGDGGEDDVMQDMLAFIRQQGGSGILYAHTRESCEQLARSLREAGLLASAYHAGLEAVVRNKRQQDWLEADDEIMVATVAFGMGVNKCNVRWVIHWNLPKSVSHFYQESGRAGRNGEASFSLVYMSAADAANNARLQRSEEGASAYTSVGKA